MHDMARDHRGGARAGRARAVGPRPLRRRACRSTSTRLRRRPRGRLRLQVPERRARRAGVPLRRRAPPAIGSRSRCRAGSATPRRSPSSAGYRPAPGIARALCGTPPVLSLAALECRRRPAAAGATSAAMRAKSMALTDAVHRAGRGALRRARPDLASPREPARRGSQVSFAPCRTAMPIMQALIARGVIGDFRAPDLLRFGWRRSTCATSTVGRGRRRCRRAGDGAWDRAARSDRARR